MSGAWKRRAAAGLVGWIVLLVSGLVGDALAQSQRRVALVMGVGAYQNAVALPNPPNDARAMTAKLQALGFDVVEALDPDQTRLRDAVSTFAAKLEGASTGLFFYAGHGVQVAGQNYLIPTDAKLERETDLYVRTVNVAEVLRVMEATVPVRLVFLDACRDNPLARRLARSMGASRSQAVGQGLAALQAADGTLIAYATAPGDVAEDGTGRNSPFTTALLQHLDVPGLEVGQMLKRVRASVLSATAKRQTPWESSSLTGDFYFAAAAGATPPPPPGPSPTQAPSPQQLDLAFWSEVKASQDPADLEEYLRQYPKGQYAGLARNRLKAIKEQQAALVPPRQVEAPKPPVEKAVGTYDLSPGQVFKDCADCPEMVVVPAGSFVMGSPEGEADRQSDEGPEHRVSVRAFAAGRTEVTRGQFARFVSATGHRAEGECYGMNAEGKGEKSSRFTWQDPGFPQGDDHPVACVSWEDAKAFVAWLGREAGKPYRLLSEAEWEYVGRAGTTSRFAWGGSADGGCGSANRADQSAKERFLSWSRASDCRDGYVFTAPVGKLAANSFGLHDTYGNVWEWVEDIYHDSYSGAPTDGSAWIVGADSRHVLRGGSWNYYPKDLRSANRGRNAPDYRSYFTGFRVARMLAP